MNITRFEPWKFVDLLHPDLARVNLRRIGVDEDTVSMDDSVLTVAGERQAQSRSEDSGARRVERASGRFSRRFSLPDSSDAESITAQSRNGILEISIPKLPEVQARRISVKAA